MAKPNQIPPLNAIKAFDAAGRHLNFRAAAAEINVTQGAVAQQVRALEAHLGLRLFERHHRGLAFTGPGRAYHEQVARAFVLLQDATANLRPEPTKVTISVTPTFASKWLIPNLPSFTADHPDIDLRILATESVLSFHSDGVDLAVRQAVPPFGAGLDAKLIFHQDIVALCAPELAAGANLPLAPEAIREMTLLHDTHNLWPAFLKHVAGIELDPAPRGLRFSQTSLSIDAALAGQGIALASRFLVAREIAAGRLVQPIAGVMRAESDFYLLAQRTPNRRQAVRAAIDWFASRATGRALGAARSE